jgi:hypothetical protein
MKPDEVEEWLQHDTHNLTLAVQAVIQATAAFDEEKVAALGRAFRIGVDRIGIREPTWGLAAQRSVKLGR